MSIVKQVGGFIFVAIGFVISRFMNLVGWWLGKARGSKSKKGAVAWFVGGLLAFCFSSSLLLNAVIPSSEDIASNRQENSELLSTSTGDDDDASRSGGIDISVVEEATGVAEQAGTAISETTSTIAPSETAVLATETATETPTETPTSTATVSPTPSATATRAPTPTSGVPRVSIDSGSANVRSGPGTNYDPIGRLTSGQTATVLGKNADGSWLVVRLPNGTTGWVGTSVIIFSSANLSAVRVAATIPAPPVVLPTSAPTAIPTVVAVATQPPTFPPPPAAACSCSSNSLNCSDFSTQSQAQACFNYCVGQGAGDIHGLDGNDNDGLACESLP